MGPGVFLRVTVMSTSRYLEIALTNKSEHEDSIDNLHQCELARAESSYDTDAVQFLNKTYCLVRQIYRKRVQLYYSTLQEPSTINSKAGREPSFLPADEKE